MFKLANLKILQIKIKTILLSVFQIKLNLLNLCPTYFANKLRKFNFHHMLANNKLIIN